MKSLTLDDILYDNIIMSHDKQGDNKNSKFYYLYNPTRKIRRNIYENLKVKHYIKIGDECPICYETINTNKDSYLTDCGHSFHYSCIINYDYNSIKNHNISCPICRQYMGNYIDIKDKYSNSNNELDKLEDFENNMKIKLPNICFNFHKFKYNNHYHRMNYNNCFYCKL
jgi:hypothetical protein